MSEFHGYGVQVELKDGKLIEGKIAKATAKGLTLSDVMFGDGGTSQGFKVRASRLRNLKVLSVGNGNGNGNVTVSQGGNKSRPSTKNGDGSGVDWQFDDVKKIKEQADFDFEGNLQMFNKKDVFAQLKQQDEVAPQERLVSHNKKQSHGDVKYENDEMVIPDSKNDAWDSIKNLSSNVKPGRIDINDEEEDDYEIDDVDNPEFFPVTNSINITHLLHSASSVGTKDRGTGNDELLTKLGNMIINQSSSTSEISAVSALSNQQDIVKQTLEAKDIKLTVPLATPIHLWEMERVAEESFGIKLRLLNENFASNASRFFKQKLGGRARLRSQNINAEPLVVIFISDFQKVGSKALALGRHLCHSNYIRVIALFTSNINELQDAHIKEQLELFKKCGGKVANSITNLQSIVEKLNSPVELIIDAMQGFDANITDLFVNSNLSEETSKTKVRTMIEWANSHQRANKQLWSIDIPTGYDSGSGQKTFTTAINPNGVLCSNWPLQALQTIKNSAKNIEDLVLIDIAIPHSVYAQKTSLRKFQNCDLFVTEGSLILNL